MDHRFWDQRYGAAELVWTAEPNRFLVAEADGMTPGHALDLGCGEGRNAIWLASQGWDVIGVDFSRVGLDKARQLAAHRHLAVEWVLGDATAYRPARAAFDLVTILYLQLPAVPLAAALDRAANALAPGGTLLVVGHDITNRTHGYGGPQDPEVLYNPDQIASGLGGLMIEKAERVHRPVETDGGTAVAIDTLVRAHRSRPPATAAPRTRTGA